MIDFPTFPLRFQDRFTFEAAVSLTTNKHPDQFDIGYSDMILTFFSESNRDEMKQQFDILGWKCNA